ncbi:glycosyltransferase family 4 protein [Planktotalea sp.]|uniref:glycosyltransferase family 4 protein n=1 Tax=Planktotalea sp. TaxID=2029877 RepID=UPI00329A24FE
MTNPQSVLAIQLGARRQYAVPAAFAQTGQLDGLYTDLCAGRGLGRFAPMLSAIPPVARRLSLSRRVPAPEVLNKTHVFPSWFWEMRAALRHGADPVERIKLIRRAHDRASERMLKRGFGNATHVLTMFGEATAFQRAAKLRGLTTVMDMNIAPSTEAIVNDEQNRNPDWEAPKIYYGQDHGASYARGLAPIMDDVLAATDIFLCPSSFVRDDLMNTFGVEAHRTRLVPYAVNPKWQMFETAPQRGRILFVGGAELRKGIHVYAKAAQILREGGLDANFCVAGDARPELCARQECDALSFLGRLNATQLEEAYKSADVVVLPSLAEGSAGVTYEALGCGLPVVTTYEAGSVVRDKIDGLIVPSRDAHALADAIATLVRDRNLRDTMASNARRRASEFGWEEFGNSIRSAVFGEGALSKP